MNWKILTILIGKSFCIDQKCILNSAFKLIFTFIIHVKVNNGLSTYFHMFCVYESLFRLSLKFGKLHVISLILYIQLEWRMGHCNGATYRKFPHDIVFKMLSIFCDIDEFLYYLFYKKYILFFKLVFTTYFWSIKNQLKMIFVFRLQNLKNT